MLICSIQNPELLLIPWPSVNRVEVSLTCCFPFNLYPKQGAIFQSTTVSCTVPMTCCKRSLTDKIKMYGRLLRSHWRRYLSSERELPLCSSESPPPSSGPLASLWEWWWEWLWVPECGCCLEPEFSPASITEFSWMWTSPPCWHDPSPGSLAAWAQWGASLFPGALWRLLEWACMVAGGLWITPNAWVWACFLKEQRDGFKRHSSAVRVCALSPDVLWV